MAKYVFTIPVAVKRFKGSNVDRNYDGSVMFSVNANSYVEAVDAVQEGLQRASKQAPGLSVAGIPPRKTSWLFAVPVALFVLLLGAYFFSC